MNDVDWWASKVHGKVGSLAPMMMFCLFNPPPFLDRSLQPPQRPLSPPPWVGPNYNDYRSTPTLIPPCGLPPRLAVLPSQTQSGEDFSCFHRDRNFSRRQLDGPTDHNQRWVRRERCLGGFRYGSQIRLFVFQITKDILRELMGVEIVKNRWSSDGILLLSKKLYFVCSLKYPIKREMFGESIWLVHFMRLINHWCQSFESSLLHTRIYINRQTDELSLVWFFKISIQMLTEKTAQWTVMWPYDWWLQQFQAKGRNESVERSAMFKTTMTWAEWYSLLRFIERGSNGYIIVVRKTIDFRVDKHHRPLGKKTNGRPLFHDATDCSVSMAPYATRAW